jgi:hypothetical protein
MNDMETVYHKGKFITFNHEQVVDGLNKMTDKEVNAYYNILQMEMRMLQSDYDVKRTLRHFWIIEDIKELRNI